MVGNLALVYAVALLFLLVAMTIGVKHCRQTLD
jgi:hypothetical protein